MTDGDQVEVHPRQGQGRKNAVFPPVDAVKVFEDAVQKRKGDDDRYFLRSSLGYPV